MTEAINTAAVLDLLVGIRVVVIILLRRRLRE